MFKVYYTEDSKVQVLTIQSDTLARVLLFLETFRQRFGHTVVVRIK
jgi:hypothetical protein